MPMNLWWDVVFKKGVKKILMDISVEDRIRKKNELNLLNRRLHYIVGKMQSREGGYHVELERTKEKINQLYKAQAKEASEKLNVREIDESETMNI